MKYYKGLLNQTKGITLTSLAVTIIVLLILAGISISTLIGDNSIIKKAEDVRERTIIAQEKEAIAFAWSTLRIDNVTKGTPINDSNFENKLNSSGNNTTVNYDEESNFLVYFIDTTHTYKVDNDGNISEEKTVLYAINFVLNGGTKASGQKTSFKAGEKVDLLDATKNNSYFQGWYETNDFSTDRITYISNKNEDITLYAKWIDETPTDYFNWSMTDTEATITGLSETGLEVYNSGELTTLAIPRTHNNLPVTTIASRAFMNKNLLTNLIIPNNVTNIGEQSTFLDCSNIEEITLPISLEITTSNINKQFKNCTGVKKINFTKGTGIGCTYKSYSSTPWSYSRNNEIEVTFEEGITSIGKYMFYDCIGLKTDAQNLIDNLPNTLTKIGERAFCGCTGITGDMVWNKGNMELEKYIFSECTGITSVTINRGLENIPEYTFYGCTGITSVTIGGSVSTIESRAFYGCTGMKELIIGDNVTNIGEQSTFLDCSNIEEITLPISLEITTSNINKQFKNCTGVKKINFTKGTGIGCTYKSYSSTPWYYSRNNEIEVTFEEGITSIGNKMFYDCTGLKNIKYKNNDYINSSIFTTIFEGDGGTVSANAFTGAGI